VGSVVDCSAVGHTTPLVYHGGRGIPLSGQYGRVLMQSVAGIKKHNPGTNLS
jgi:hypothetical protein